MKKYRWMVGWIEKKQMNGWKDKKNRWIVGWMEGYTIIYIFFNRCMVGRKTKLFKKQMVGWMDRIDKIDGWLDRWIEKKQMDTKMEEKNRQIPKWKIGWIEKYGWLDG